VDVPEVETLRKPSTGLKHDLLVCGENGQVGRDTQKTQHGIETARRRTRGSASGGRDTQKTQHGIETNRHRADVHPAGMSRHSENPARD